LSKRGGASQQRHRKRSEQNAIHGDTPHFILIFIGGYQCIASIASSSMNRA